MSDADELRAELADHWERAAAGWGRQAQSMRTAGMPVSRWMIEHAALRPGQRVLELAAGPGDTGFMAAEAIRPGTLVCSDASEAMLELARERAGAQGVENVEFARLQLEWIDLPTADVDAILCRWGLMLCLDPSSALLECRRVLRPGGRLVAAVWDAAQANPWVTIPSGALEAVGVTGPPAGGPGMFALGDAAALSELLAEAGFLEVAVEPVEIEREYPTVDDWLQEMHDCSVRFGEAWRSLDGPARTQLSETVEVSAARYRDAQGTLRVPGRCLCASACA